MAHSVFSTFVDLSYALQSIGVSKAIISLPLSDYTRLVERLREETSNRPFVMSKIDKLSILGLQIEPR